VGGVNAETYVELREGRGAAVRRVNGGWQVTCPAHEDRTPSLAVTIGRDGRVLLHCHAGCEVADVLAADGLELADLFQERRNGRVEIGVYQYVDERGVVLFEVGRFDPKAFLQRRPGRRDWKGGIEGVRRVLYRLPKVLEAIAAGERVYLVEGEKDVHAIERAGAVATCNPMGAGKGKWRAEYAETLRGAHVVVVADKDKEGRDHARRITASLGTRAATVEVVEAAAGKDAHDHLAAGRALGELVPVDLDRVDETAPTVDTKPDELRARLAKLLRVADAEIRVLAIRMVGNGSTAALEIDLSNNLTIATERFGDLWTHAGLAKFVTQNTGVNAGAITKKEAEEANALIRQLARIERVTSTADLGRDHGFEFLRDAPTAPFRLADQDSRYDAFRRVDGLDPVRALEGGGLFDAPASVASASLVLLDEPTGDRYVHCSHLFDDVRRRGRVAHPAELARRMELAGWNRRGKRGRIKATPSSGIGDPVVLPLWRVPPGWEATVE
jgi:5S rRNA maturation endonuclease (ribonuclease M5)